MRPPSVRLHPRFDAAQLAGELGTLAQFERRRPGPFPTAGWEGIALVQGDGRVDDTRSPLPSRRGPQPTLALASCPALAKVIVEMPAPVLVARLLYLQPGGSAALHRDPIGFPVGTVRLHVPIVTHPDVELWLGGERAEWGLGELWYGDFAYPHRLANPSPVTRVHLVLDVCVNDALLAWFPPAVIPAVLAGGAYRHLPARVLSEAELGRFTRRLDLPPNVLPGVAGDRPLDAAPYHGAVALFAGDEPTAVLDPVGPDTLCIRGYYPGVTIEYHADGGVELVHRGRIGIPEGRSADDERTPWELHTARWLAA